MLSGKQLRHYIVEYCANFLEAYMRAQHEDRTEYFKTTSNPVATVICAETGKYEEF